MKAEWVAVDWGTTNLRVWVFASDGSLVDQASSGKGMGMLERDDFEAALAALIAEYMPKDGGTLPVICCGMVGARQGWKEAPYAQVPCRPPGIEAAVSPKSSDPRLTVRILPGVSQDSPADVMRGEETQIAGYLASDPDFDGVLCLPGTHTKWVHISAGEIVSFRTFMTGELFALLAGQSVLRHGMTGDGWNDATFAEAVDDAFGRPQSVAADLFSLRAAGLLHGMGPEAARARLSGLLIGLELAGARPYWLGQRVVLLGSETLSAHYETALSRLGAHGEIVNAIDVTRDGLCAAYESWRASQ